MDSKEIIVATVPEFTPELYKEVLEKGNTFPTLEQYIMKKFNPDTYIDVPGINYQSLNKNKITGGNIMSVTVITGTPSTGVNTNGQIIGSIGAVGGTPIVQTGGVAGQGIQTIQTQGGGAIQIIPNGVAGSIQNGALGSVITTGGVQNGGQIILTPNQNQTVGTVGTVGTNQVVIQGVATQGNQPVTFQTGGVQTGGIQAINTGTPAVGGIQTIQTGGQNIITSTGNIQTQGGVATIGSVGTPVIGGVQGVQTVGVAGINTGVGSISTIGGVGVPQNGIDLSTIYNLINQLIGLVNQILQKLNSLPVYNNGGNNDYNNGNYGYNYQNNNNNQNQNGGGYGGIINNLDKYQNNQNQNGGGYNNNYYDGYNNGNGGNNNPNVPASYQNNNNSYGYGNGYYN